jgi:hypothetical protein
MSETIESKLMPSIGDRVKLHLNGSTITQSPIEAQPGYPLAATVAFVWGVAMVNLNVIDHNGKSHGITSVAFIQPGAEPPSSGAYCELDVYLGELVEGEAIAMSEDQKTEQAIVQAGAHVAPRVTPADIEANIDFEWYFTGSDGVKGATNGDMDHSPELLLLTFCVLVLRNGFTVTGESACASRENFNAEIGRKIARQNAVQKIWPLMGYELRSKLAAA